MTTATIQPGNVAVVTGAALGIGRAMCRMFAKAGMSVVLVDLEGPDLDATAAMVEALSPHGLEAVLAVPTDVADPMSIDRLRNAAMSKFGKVNLLANNAVTRIGRGLD